MIILDCIIAVMLMISIVYSWQLNKKIAELRNNKKDFIEIIKQLDDTIIRAENGIDELKLLNNQVNFELSNKIDKAKYVYEDLVFISDRATISAEKMDKAISEARKFEKFDFVKFHQEQLEKYKKSLLIGQKLNINNSDIINNFDPEELNKKEEVINHKPVTKVAIESLLARISAVKNNRERVTQ